MAHVAGMASSYEGVGLVALWWLDGLCRRHGQLLRGRGTGGFVVVGWSVSQAWPALTEGVGWVALWWLDGLCRRRGQLLRGRVLGGFMVAGWSMSQAWPALARAWVVVAGWPIS